MNKRITVRACVYYDYEIEVSADFPMEDTPALLDFALSAPQKNFLKSAPHTEVLSIWDSETGEEIYDEGW